MKPSPYGPFPYSPIIHRPRLTWPNGARVALWIIPNIEFFSLEERPGGYGPAGKIPDVVMWSDARLRQSRRRVAHDGGARPLRHPRHRRAQQPVVRSTIPSSSRRATSASGSGWAITRATRAASTKRRPARKRRSSRDTFATIERATGAAPQGLAQLRPAGDLGLARPPRGRNGGRIRVRLVQRRPALRHASRRRTPPRLGAL